MEQLKSWLLSKTVWASAFGILLQVLTVAHIQVPGLQDVDANVFAGHMVNLASAVSFLAAIYFRVTAKHKLT
jgi:hypothetical protein